MIHNTHCDALQAGHVLAKPVSIVRLHSTAAADTELAIGSGSTSICLFLAANDFASLQCTS